MYLLIIVFVKAHFFYKEFSMRFFIFLVSIFIYSQAIQAQVIRDVSVNSVESAKDDEEAPIDIRSGNKLHRCGGKQSNVYRIYSDNEAVQNMRFKLVLEALTSGRSLTLTTDSCEGAVMLIKKVRLHR